MNFGEALEALKLGKKVTRAGWNGKGMFLFLVPGSTFQVNRPPLLGIYPEGTEINYLVEGKMTIQNKELNKGDIFILKPYEIADPIFLEDCTVLIIKTPSKPGDKFII